MIQAGAVQAVLDPARPLGPQIAALVAAGSAGDTRDALGLERGGRPLAHAIAARVVREATGSSEGSWAGAVAMTIGDPGTFFFLTSAFTWSSPSIVSRIALRTRGSSRS